MEPEPESEPVLNPESTGVVATLFGAAPAQQHQLLLTFSWVPGTFSARHDSLRLVPGSLNNSNIGCFYIPDCLYLIAGICYRNKSIKQKKTVEKVLIIEPYWISTYSMDFSIHIPNSANTHPVFEVAKRGFLKLLFLLTSIANFLANSADIKHIFKD